MTDRLEADLRSLARRAITVSTEPSNTAAARGGYVPAITDRRSPRKSIVALAVAASLVVMVTTIALVLNRHDRPDRVATAPSSTTTAPPAAVTRAVAFLTATNTITKVSSVAYVASNRHTAVAHLIGEGVDGDEAVWALQITGDVTSRPHGLAPQPAVQVSALLAVIDQASGIIVDSGSGDAVDLSQLGDVHSLPTGLVTLNSRRPGG